MNAPVLTPETPSNFGSASAPEATVDQPKLNPAPNAPRSPPPESSRKSSVASGRAVGTRTRSAHDPRCPYGSRRRLASYPRRTWPPFSFGFRLTFGEPTAGIGHANAEIRNDQQQDG